MSKDEKKIDPLADDTPDELPATDSTTRPENEPSATDSTAPPENEPSATDSTAPPENELSATDSTPPSGHRGGSWTRRRRNSARCGAISRV